MTSRKTPIVIGIGDIRNKSLSLTDALEPMQLMLQATQAAIADTSLPYAAQESLQANIDSISVVATWTWNYHDLPGLIGERLGVKPSYKVLSHHGGNSPAKLFDEAARRISFGEAKVAVVTGGEALASLGACAAADKLPPPGWAEEDAKPKKITLSDVKRSGQNLGSLHSIGLPIHVYPLYENAFRAHRNQSIADNDSESAKLYAEFAKVAEGNPMAWNYGKKAATEQEIGTVGKKNRMICFPYPLLMNAFNNVNLAATCILTSTEYAKELGVAEDKWIYPLGGAGIDDSEQFWNRPNFYYSPSISRSLDSALAISNLSKQEIDLFDFYSCFPIVPKLAAHHLSLPLLNSQNPLTLLGGLTSFGGAGNNYSMHALTAMVRELRKGVKKTGLILANGGVATHQHVVCISSLPRKLSPYPEKNPLPEMVQDVFVPEIVEVVDGEQEAVVETYTVQFGRDGKPDVGFVVGRLMGDGRRFVANQGDEATLGQLASRTREPIGRRGWVKGGEDGRNLFCFEKGGKL